MRKLHLLLLLCFLCGCAKKQNDKKPEPPRQSAKPTTIKKPAAVSLNGKNVEAFIAWASASGIDEKEKVRAELKQSSRDQAVLDDLIRRFEKVDTLDLSYSLLVLSLIGELQNPAAMPWLLKQVNRSIPPRKDDPHGGLGSTDVIEMIASKAVEGLSYLKTKEADRLVLNTISRHPSTAVRSAAIDAYLYNHDDSREAKATLQKTVQQSDLILLDRERFNRIKDTKSFNATQENFYKLHPEQLAQAPGKPTKKASERDTTNYVKPIEPPKLNKN